MVLTLHNTLTRKKAPFTPLDPKNVRMYVCGPTVYDNAHIGNARPIIVFDVLYRLLRHIYGADHVTYARNITDVDDKINARAAQEYPGMPLNEAIAKVTSETTKQFHEDIKALGVLMPEDVNHEDKPQRFFEPACTDHIPQMVEMIKVLIAKGNAYEAEGHVLLDTTTIPDYGRLSGRSLDEMIAGARVEVAPYKRNPADSVLWKPSTDEQPGWDSPWGPKPGRGRPGWHIECSAMSKEYLGEVFDIHGGGIDLTFPHHENELAQSTCVHGTSEMAQVWMHNGYLQVEGRKMSKSEGNFVTISELLNTENFGGRKWPGEVLRLAMLMTHYRQPIDWTISLLEQAYSTWVRWGKIKESAGIAQLPQLTDRIERHLANDLNTPGAIAELHVLAKEAEAGSQHAAQELYVNCGILGIEFKEFFTDEFYTRGVRVIDSEGSSEIELLVEARNKARAAKDWAESDRIRDELDAMGIVLKDGPEGTIWEVKQ